MCIIERKTYYHTNGREETIEKARPCHRAVGNRLCKHVERRSFEAARIVETKPSSSSTTPPEKDREGYIVTEGTRGQQRMYRDLSKRSSNSSSIRRSATMSDRTTPVSTPSSASSPSYVELKPEAPSPPAAAPGFPFGERTRTPYSSSKPRPSFTKDGTATYEHPLSFDQPRAYDRERSASSNLEKESSFSSTTAEVDEVDEPALSERRRRPSISIDTTTRPTTSSSTTSASTSSPGLSQLKSALRRDSGKDVDRRSSRGHRADSDRQRRQERQDEDDRQAGLERERLAASDRRQSTRDKLARDASHERRERHRREAAETLEGTRTPASARDDAIQQGREAERAEMERERERAAQLRREDDLSKQYCDDQLRRDADARARFEARQRTDSARPRFPPQAQLQAQASGSPRPSSASPTSARSPITSARAFSGSNNTSVQPMQPRVHQQVPPPLRRESQGQTISERGADVIARERAKAAGQSLNEALGGMSLQDEREKEAEEYQARMREGGGGGGARDDRYRYGYGDSRRRYR